MVHGQVLRCPQAYFGCSKFLRGKIAPGSDCLIFSVDNPDSVKDDKQIFCLPSRLEYNEALFAMG